MNNFQQQSAAVLRCSGSRRANDCSAQRRAVARPPRESRRSVPARTSPERSFRARSAGPPDTLLPPGRGASVRETIRPGASAGGPTWGAVGPPLESSVRPRTDLAYSRYRHADKTRENRLYSIALPAPDKAARPLGGSCGHSGNYWSQLSPRCSRSRRGKNGDFGIIDRRPYGWIGSRQINFRQFARLGTARYHEYDVQAVAMPITIAAAIAHGRLMRVAQRPRMASSGGLAGAGEFS